MKRLAIGTLVALGVTVLLAAAVLSWLVTTESGLRLVWSQVERFVPLDVEMALSGRLIGPVVVTGLEVTTGSLRVTLERAELDWEPLALLGDTVNIDRLDLQGLDVFVLPADPDAVPAEPFELPRSLVLPVNVNLETATLEGMRLFATEGGEPFVIDTAALSVHFDDDELLFHELVVRAPLFDVDGRVNITPGGDYASELELDWALRPPGYPAAGATTMMFGDRREMTVRQTVEAPYSIDAEFDVLQPFTQLTLDGSAALRVVPGELGLDLPLERIDANASFEGGLENLTLTVGADLTSAEFVDARVDFAGTYTGDAVAVESLRVQDAGSAAALELAGLAELGGAEPAVDLMGEWASLQWPLRGEALVDSESGSLRLVGTAQDLLAEFTAEVGTSGSIEGSVRRQEDQLAVDLAWQALQWPRATATVSSDRGRLTVDGTLDAYTTTLDADLEVATGTAGHVRAAGNGSTSQVELQQIDIAVLDGTLTGSGAFAWDPVVTGSVSLTADSVNPGVLSAEWSGRVGGLVEADASTDENGLLSVRLGTLTLDGELRGRTVDLDASGRYSGETVVVDVLALRSGDTLVDADGTLGSDLDFSWSIDSPDIADLWPDIVGRLTARGNASGPRERPIVSMDAQGSGLELEAFDVSIAEFSLRGQLDAAGLVDSELALALGDARLLGREIQRLNFDASGNAARHTLTLAALAEDADVRLALNASLDAPWQSDFEWNFELERAALGFAEFEPWTLRNPSSGLVTGSGMELMETCWQSGDAELCAAAMREQTGTAARFRLAALPFQYFSTLIPDGARITGTVDASGDLVFVADGPPQVSIDIATSPGRIGPAVTGGRSAGLAFGRAAGNVVWDGESLVTNLAWPFEGQQGSLDLQATISQSEGAPFTESAIDGNVRIEARSLAFLSNLVIGVENTGGSVSGDIGVSGTIAEPQLVGRLELVDGTARLREPGVVLENVRLALVGDGRGGIGVEGELTSGGGIVEAEGRLSLEEALPVGRLSMRGEDFELFNTPDARLFVTPDLRLELTRDRIELTGEVVVPRAELTPRGATEGAVPISQDQVIVDAEDEARSNLSRPLYARVELSLGEDVSFEGFGLTGNLAGAIEIIEVPAEPTTGSGELRVEEGTYVAYGQELEIRTGRLLFAGGAIARPGIDIEAVRRPAEDILVGARVRGTLSQPELSVFSEPPMPEQEQLSYLVLGRPLEGASASESSAMSQAAMALGLRGGNFVSERLNETLGFDEFGIQSQPGGASSAASFVIGKYLSPSLYVSYGVGLFEPVNTLRLRYTMSSRWRLVTESSSAGSGWDLIYNIERGN